MIGVSMITLGVDDIAKATEFYEALGLKRSGASQESVTFFQAGPAVLGLYGLKGLAEDGQTDDVWTGKGGFSISFNLPGREQVDQFMARAEEVGAKILKKPQNAFWGGYHGHFADLDGHVWEIAYNPFVEVSDDGEMKLP